MAVVLSSTAKTAHDDVPLSHPRIGIEDWFSASVSTVTVSSEDADHPKENATDHLDWDYWKPTSMDAWIAVDAGDSRDITYMGVAGHDFFDQDVTATPQYSTDGGSTWNNATGSKKPADNGPIMFLFDNTVARHWRLHLSGSNIPSVGIVQVGRALAFERALYQGHTPLSLSRDTEIRPNRAGGGKRLGRSIIRRGNSTTFEVDNLTADWVRNHLDPFIQVARTRGFFLAWRPSKFPNEVGWVWTNDDIHPQNTGPRDLMSVSFDVTGVAYGGV